MSAVGREVVLLALRAVGGRSAHLMEIVQLLDQPKDNKDAVRDVLDQLVQLGLARSLPGNRFRLGTGRRPTSAGTEAPPTKGPSRAPRASAEAGPAAAVRGLGASAPATDPVAPSVPRRVESDGGNVTGWLAMTARGFAFVSADDGGPDVFVGARALGQAMHGDRVELRVRRSAQGREGEVARVLERGMLRVAGRLARVRRVLLLETADPRIPPTFRIVGAVPLGTEPGMDVVCQITQYPDAEGEIPEARVLRVLGPRGSAEVEIAKTLIRENVAEEFPEDVVQEALGFPAEVPAHDARAREDLRGFDLVTIDPDDARDHDDAVWAECLDDGSFRVIIAIADVSHYVRPGSCIDREALARGCSIYLPGRAIPMLPPELSSNLASLVPDEDRLTLAVEVRLGKMGKVLSHRLIEGVMRSAGRLTYGGVARALGLTDEGPRQPGAESRLPMLKTLHMISRRLRAIRTRRGALEFQLPEAKVLLGPDGEPTDVVRSRGDAGVKQAYELVEDLMLLANEVVAEDLTRRALPAIYRVHGKPDAKKVATFAAVAEAFGHALEEGAEESPRKLQQFLLKVADTEHASSLGFLLLRAMQQASYDIANIGHFALAARDYLHFTSPIRRYPDLAVHRVVRSLARGEHIDVESLRTRLQLQARQSSRMERRAMTVERETVSLYRCILLKDRVGEEFDGSITGVTENGLSVSLDQPFVDVRVPVERLGDDYYEIDRLGIRLAGRRTGHGFSLGQRVRLRLESVNVERREVVAVPTSLPESRRKRGSETAPARTRDERARGAGKEPRSHHDAPRDRQAPLRDGRRRADDGRPRGARPAATRSGAGARSAGPSRGTHPRDMPLSPTKKDGKNRRSR